MEQEKTARADLIRAACVALADAPDGLPLKSVTAQVAARLKLTPWDQEPFPSHPAMKRFEAELHFSSIGEVKAGWIQKRKGVWSLSDAGRRALEQYPDPSAFHDEARRIYGEWAGSEEAAGESSSALDRSSADHARQLLTRFYPDEGVRALCEEQLATSIRAAEEARQGAWSVSMFSNRVRLNVGRVFVFDLIPASVRMVVDGLGMSPEDVKALNNVGQVEPWATGIVPEFITITVPAKKIGAAWSALQEGHEKAIRRAAQAATRSPYAQAHSPGVTAMLREDVGFDLRDPKTSEPGDGAPSSLQIRPLAKALRQWDRDAARAQADEAEEERKRITAEFPLSAWPTMSLERYALGHEKGRDSFCYVLEYGSPRLGSIKGGSASKLIIYKHATKPGWFFDARYSSEETAWEAVRGAFLEAFQLAEAEDFAAIDRLVPLRPGSALRAKALFTYFPDRFLPIYTVAHLDHFTRLLGGPSTTLETVAANRRLFELVHALPEFQGWSNFEIGSFLYYWAHPRQTRRIVKIAPGQNARFWEECREGGYICVGWDKVGDLLQFASQEEFKERFSALYLGEYKGSQATATVKAKEVWTLRDLEPGDLVVANKGISHVLAVGTVVEPGYVWRPERAEFKHTVNVKWDDSVETDIDPIPQWATKTVANVPQDLYTHIMQGSVLAGPESTRIEVAPDDLLAMLGNELDRRGQAILYGPPGTGKTYTARRFSVWWLRSAWKHEDAKWVLGDKQLFDELEAELTAVPDDDPTRAAILTRVTFHPSYAYEDFIEGFKPRPTEGRGGLELVLTDGAFKRVCREAANDPEKRPYLILIDEINRGNIPKIFGELITLLEKDKRGFEVLLPQSGKRFSVPGNVFVVGTMNTADRSIRLLDAALRRRFSFVELMPDPETLAGGIVEGRLSLELFLEQLNERIARQVGREKQIGQSYFMDKSGAPVTTAEEFAPRFIREVVPLLQEYAYDDFEIFTSILGEGLVDAERQRLKRDIIEDPQALVEALASEFKSGDVSEDSG